MPEDSPERFEAGTLGLPGIMALGAGMREVRRVGLQRIYRNEMAIADRFYRGLQHIPGVRVVNRGFKMGEYVPVVSFCIGDRDGGTVSEQLSAQGFMLRGGYHCAGMIHDLLGTRDTGTVRFACGRGAAPGQVDALLKVVKKNLCRWLKLTENLVTMVERKSMSTDTLCSGISCQTGLLFAADLRIILISFIYGPVFSAMLIYNPACQPTQD